MEQHLAELNIGRVLGGPDDPRMADFFANLARINALAERSPGFVWRLKDSDGHSAMALRWPDDPTMNMNMSVWESSEALARFVFQTVHRKIYARKHDFFQILQEPMFVMWWVAPGHLPTLEEAKTRLDRYRAEGSSEHAFGWSDLAESTALTARRCG